MIKFTEKEIELMNTVCSYKKINPSHGMLAMKLNKDQRSISSAFFRMRERHRVRSNEELIQLFKKRYENVGENLQENSKNNKLMQDNRPAQCSI